MKIAISCDHRGKHVYEMLADLVRSAGHETVDVRICTADNSDYPDYAYAVGAAVAGGHADRGILISGWGVGMSVAANKIRGIRAAVAEDEVMAEMCRRHIDANVLCLPAEMLSEPLIKRIVVIWLETTFEGGRHARRVSKILAIEAGCDPTTVVPVQHTT